MKYLVSVIIPTYKPGEYLMNCLDSLCRQDVEASVYEIIVVLNGPLEGYRESIEAYRREHDHYHIDLLTTDMKGVSNARNLGIDHAQGEYLIFIDDDDWVSPDYLSQLIQRASTGRIVCSNVRQVDEVTGEEMDNYIAEAYRHHPKEADASLFECRSFLSSACCKIIPRTAIGPTRFAPHFALGEDSLFMFTISNRLHQIAFAPATCLYFVRARHGSASRSDIGFGSKLSNLTQLCAAYTRVWLTHPFGYSFPLYLSRIVATLLKLFRRSY
jgi:glycosyltransferase involved in cell wall biosynthesis